MRTALLDKDDLDQIADIGKERHPVEACGILLPTPFRGRKIWEMPNRSFEPNTFELRGEDVSMTLVDWFNTNDRALWHQVVVWHTHPSGTVGPSRQDMASRVDGCCNLVVTIDDTGKSVAAFF